MNSIVPKLHKWGLFNCIGNVLFRNDEHAIHVRHRSENTLGSKAIYKDKTIILIFRVTKQSFLKLEFKNCDLY